MQYVNMCTDLLFFFFLSFGFQALAINPAPLFFLDFSLAQ